MRYEMNRTRYYLNFAKMEPKISAETVEDTYNLTPYLGVLVDLVYKRDSGDLWFAHAPIQFVWRVRRVWRHFDIFSARSRVFNWAIDTFLLYLLERDERL